MKAFVLAVSKHLVPTRTFLRTTLRGAGGDAVSVYRKSNGSLSGINMMLLSGSELFSMMSTFHGMRKISDDFRS